ncbi:DUF3558 domain-containing protein [Nocardia mexicana]|uniref:Uncharacterized protein DUF3558 n=1 Tax=Nocardia mexicana TaxID=279262 RepID=A0A370H0G2_9NOCA|nr:DUF3558 domain-containing protein [Nocardia mexicana]RDI49368.1 uncharacterized protein DUF3558 [Nocardia mexicana]
MARRLAIFLLAAMVPAMAACNDGGGNGTSGSATATAEAKLWDPCTQIPDDALVRAGVDPKTEESGIAGVHQSGWEICNWKGKQYTLSVLSGKRTADEIVNKEGNVEQQDVVVAGRAGRQFRVNGGTKDLTCDVVFPATQGAVELTLINRASLDNPENPCALLGRVGDQLVPILPK